MPEERVIRPSLPRRASLKRVPMKRAVSKPKRRVKAKSASQLKKQLDTIFSLYIRAKYQKKCYTCAYTGTNLQNGHWIPRGYMMTRWEEDNCRPQCRNCNVFRHGLPFEFEEHLVKEIGLARVQELKEKRKEVFKTPKSFYTTQIEIFSKKLLELQRS